MSLERADIQAAIRDAGGNISIAAERLGVARRTLQNRMRTYAIPKGRAGRRKRKISYRRKSSIVAMGVGVAVSALAVGLSFRGKRALPRNPKMRTDF